MCILEENSYSIFFPGIYAPFKFLFVWNFSSHSRIFHSFGDVTITGEGLQILTYAWHSHLMLERLSVELSLPVLTTQVCRGWDQNIQPSACGANATPRYRIGKLSIYSNDEPERVYHVLCMKVLGENQVQYQTIIVFYRIFNDPWYLVPKIATFDY